MDYSHLVVFHFYQHKKVDIKLLKDVNNIDFFFFFFFGSAEDYKVTSLPGIDIDTLNFTQYAGYK